MENALLLVRIKTSVQYQEYTSLYEKVLKECLDKGEDESENELLETLYVLIKDYDGRKLKEYNETFKQRVYKISSEEILKSKVDYYGEVPAAYQFALEEYERQVKEALK